MALRSVQQDAQAGKVTESDYTSKVVTYLKNKGTMTFKHCDRFTAGIPDVSSSRGGNTTWLEMKILKRGENMFDRVAEDKIQRFNMAALEISSRAYYVIVDSKVTYIVHPRFFISPYQDDKRIVEDSFMLYNDVSEYEMSRALADFAAVKFSVTHYQPIYAVVGI